VGKLKDADERGEIFGLSSKKSVDVPSHEKKVGYPLRGGGGSAKERWGKRKRQVREGIRDKKQKGGWVW